MGLNKLTKLLNTLGSSKLKDKIIDRVKSNVEASVSDEFFKPKGKRLAIYGRNTKNPNPTPLVKTGKLKSSLGVKREGARIFVAFNDSKSKLGYLKKKYRGYFHLDNKSILNIAIRTIQKEISRAK